MISLLVLPDLTQSLAQYHLRELQKCLAHASEQSGEGIGTSGMNDLDDIDDSNEDFHGDPEDEGGDLGYDDMRCPNPICKKLEEFETIKELRRHYAIRNTPHCSSRQGKQY